MYCPGNTLTVTTDGTTDSFDNDMGEGWRKVVLVTID